MDWEHPSGALPPWPEVKNDPPLLQPTDQAPQCMINGRIAAHDPAGADFISMGDNYFPDPKNAPKVPWETPATMNHSWGYNRLDFQWQTFDQLLGKLINNASLGGAITLNVGPLGDGAFQQAATRRLFAKGDLPETIRSTTGTDPEKPAFI